MVAKKELEVLSLDECQGLADRVRQGFDLGLSMADGLVPEDVEPAGSLDGMIGGLSACRRSDREGKSIGWLLGVLVRARDERDKAQVEMVLEDGEAESGEEEVGEDEVEIEEEEVEEGDNA